MNCIAAIARLTVIESLRRRVFVGVAGFAAAFVVVAALLPSVDAGARVQLLQAWAYRLILFFGILVTLMLASFSIPEDVETRRFQTLLSKPVRRTHVMIGKFLGFLGVLTAFLALLGLLSVALMRAVGTFGGGGSDRALLPDVVRQASEFRAGPEAKPATFSGRAEVHQQVGGPLDRALAWRFDGVTRSRFGEEVTVRFRVRLGLIRPEEAGRFGDAQEVVCEVVNPARPGAAPTRFPMRPWTRNWETVKFPVAEAEPGGTLWIRLLRTSGNAWMAGTPDSMELLAPCGLLGFEWNFVKGLVLVFLQVAIVLSLTLAVSLFASPMVTLIAGLFFALCCSMTGFLKDALATSEAVVQEMGRQAAHVHRVEAWDFPAWMVEAANEVTQVVLWLIPDFASLDYGRFLVANSSVPLLSIVGPLDALRYAIFWFVPLLLACLVARRKEFV